MSLKITLVAVVDGDKAVESMKLPLLADAELDIKIELTYQGTKIQCETLQDAIAVVNELSGRNTGSKALPVTEGDAQP